MQIEHKLIAFGISAALVAVLSTVTYNFYDSTIRNQAYEECLKVNAEIAKTALNKDGAFRYSVIPTCYHR